MERWESRYVGSVMSELMFMTSGKGAHPFSLLCSLSSGGAHTQRRALSPRGNSHATQSQAMPPLARPVGERITWDDAIIKRMLGPTAGSPRMSMVPCCAAPWCLSGWYRADSESHSPTNVPACAGTPLCDSGEPFRHSGFRS